jgi:hypothetical protein
MQAVLVVVVCSSLHLHCIWVLVVGVFHLSLRVRRIRLFESLFLLVGREIVFVQEMTGFTEIVVSSEDRVVFVVGSVS